MSRPEGPLRQGVKLVEEGRNQGRVDCHGHNGDEEHERPQVESHIGTAVEQDVHKSCQRERSNDDGQRQRLQQVREEQSQRLIVESMPAEFTQWITYVASSLCSDSANFSCLCTTACGACQSEPPSSSMPDMKPASCAARQDM